MTINRTRELMRITLDKAIELYLSTLYVLFFIELGTGRIYQTGCTMNPDTTWVTQQARQLVWYLKDYPQDMAFLIHDNDKKLSSSFDTVFSSEGI